eukprot:TRINITY_DN7513_c0_g1_i1.p1 TRINITY_DN7513_c0_g1~~TRINITY_DN7513_c0_g1_i1.p1  ORF type:complete len:385 (+),score=40.18 TRINITY_DN7513_c0_g1_i1:113-1267(+)
MMISTTRNGSYQPVVTNFKTAVLFQKLIEKQSKRDVTSVHVISKNGANVCSHVSECPLHLSAISLIQKNDKPAVCKCKKQLIGRVDLRFKPDVKARKYQDCMTFQVSALEASGELKGLSYRLRRPHCKECKYPKQLPKGSRLSWKIIIDLQNPCNGLTLRGTQTLRCFVDTSGHTAAHVPISFEKLISTKDGNSIPSVDLSPTEITAFDLPTSATTSADTPSVCQTSAPIPSFGITTDFPAKLGTDTASLLSQLKTGSSYFDAKLSHFKPATGGLFDTSSFIPEEIASITLPPIHLVEEDKEMAYFQLPISHEKDLEEVATGFNISPNYLSLSLDLTEASAERRDTTTSAVPFYTFSEELLSLSSIDGNTALSTPVVSDIRHCT